MPYYTRAHLLRAFWPLQGEAQGETAAAITLGLISRALPSSPPQPTDVFSWYLAVRKAGCMWEARSVFIFLLHFTFQMYGRACIVVINIEVWSLVCLWRRHIRKLWWVSSDQGREAAVRRQLRVAQRAAGTRSSDYPTLVDPGSKPQQHQKQPLLPHRSCMLLKRAWKNHSVIPPFWNPSVN